MPQNDDRISRILVKAMWRVAELIGLATIMLAGAIVGLTVWWN